jgi:hypothetical protein
MKAFYRCLFYAGLSLLLVEVSLAFGSRMIVAKLWDFRPTPLQGEGHVWVADRDWPRMTNPDDEDELIAFSNELSRGALIILSLGDLFLEYLPIAASPAIALMIAAMFGLHRWGQRHIAPSAIRSSNWAIPAVRELLNDPNDRVRESAALTLTRLESSADHEP